jgi:hypothetical protein
MNCMVYELYFIKAVNEVIYENILWVIWEDTIIILVWLWGLQIVPGWLKNFFLLAGLWFLCHDSTL